MFHFKFQRSLWNVSFQRYQIFKFSNPSDSSWLNVELHPLGDLLLESRGYPLSWKGLSEASVWFILPWVYLSVLWDHFYWTAPERFLNWNLSSPTNTQVAWVSCDRWGAEMVCYHSRRTPLCLYFPQLHKQWSSPVLSVVIVKHFEQNLVYFWEEGKIAPPF